MAGMDFSLQAIPPPGVAINPSYIAQQPENLIMKGSLGGKHFTVTDSNGREIFKFDGERFSMSHRIAVMEISTGQKLCTLRRENFQIGAHYYAEVGEGGSRLFDLESKIAMGAEKFVVRLSNAAAGGQGVVLDWKSPRFSTRGELYLNGVLVAGFERKLFKVKGEYHIYVAPGMDKLLAACVMACVHDRRATSRSSGSVAVAASTS